MIRVWDTSKDASQEPKVVNDADEGVTSLDCSVGHAHMPLLYDATYPKPYLQHNSWISASHDSNVRKYSSASDVFEGLITRSPAVAVRCVALSPDGQRVAVTSE